MTDERAEIDIAQVTNGSVLEAVWPMCWTMAVQYLCRDEWVVLCGSEPPLVAAAARDEGRMSEWESVITF